MLMYSRTEETRTSVVDRLFHLYLGRHHKKKAFLVITVHFCSYKRTNTTSLMTSTIVKSQYCYPPLLQETFEADLAASQKEEAANQKAYEDLKAAKEAEIAAGQEQIDKKTDELAATDEKLANDKVRTFWST